MAGLAATMTIFRLKLMLGTFLTLPSASGRPPEVAQTLRQVGGVANDFLIGRDEVGVGPAIDLLRLRYERSGPNDEYDRNKQCAHGVLRSRRVW